MVILNINNKLRLLNNSNIVPIVCIGETLEENESGIAYAVLENQLKKASMYMFIM